MKWHSVGTASRIARLISVVSTIYIKVISKKVSAAVAERIQLSALILKHFRSVAKHLFVPAVGVVGMLGILPASSSAQGGDIEFEVSLTKDTFVVYESIWVEFLAHNRGREPFARRALIIGDQHIMVEAIEIETGGLIPTCVDAESYTIPQGQDSLQVIAPGETYRGAGDLTYNASCNYDLDLRIKYWSPGHYRAVFHWTYDPRGLSRINDSPFLTDSIEFVVVQPKGELRNVADAFLLARRSYFVDNPQTSAGLMWDVVEKYPESPYAGQALKHLETMVYQGGPLPNGVSKHKFYLKFIDVAPDRPECSRILRGLSHMLEPTEFVRYLKDLRDNKPDSYAGRQASLFLLEDGVE